MTSTGYAHPRYAASLSEFGRPFELARSGGWLLERAIGDGQERDATGCYPLFSCPRWAALRDDLEQLRSDLISVALVADPFGEGVEELALRSCFDHVVHFKDHVVVGAEDAPAGSASRHHRYYARRSLRRLRVEWCEDPTAHLAEWIDLYRGLIERHQVTGVQAFSEEAFAKQLEVPGLVMFRATESNRVVGMQLWYVQDAIAYSHLTAVTPAGYELRASYGIYWEAMRQLVDRRGETLRWLDLGAGAGLDNDATDGLTVFKRGWSQATRPAYFCGKILDVRRYDELARRRAVDGSGYFPAYRAPT